MEKGVEEVEDAADEIEGVVGREVVIESVEEGGETDVGVDIVEVVVGAAEVELVAGVVEVGVTLGAIVLGLGGVKVVDGSFAVVDGGSLGNVAPSVVKAVKS